MPFDKAGNLISPGDTVSFVYGGDLHLMEVTGVVADSFTHLLHVRGDITVTIPTGATSLEHRTDATERPAEISPHPRPLSRARARGDESDRQRSLGDALVGDAPVGDAPSGVPSVPYVPSSSKTHTSPKKGS